MGWTESFRYGKRKGMTSFDCVYKVRKILKQKVGHSGTLDPEVDGVLPICIGKATKVVGGESSRSQ